MARLDFIAAGDNLITSNGLQYRVRGEIPVDINSFDVTFYQTDSDPRTVDKYLGNPWTTQGTLREGTSIVNPVILVECTIPGFIRNYAYIPIFQRYYFITDVKSVRKNLWEISLKCDVLMTFKSGILSIRTRVLRSESNHNWNYTDTLPPIESGAQIITKDPYLLKPMSGRWSPPFGANTTAAGGLGFIQVKFVASSVNGEASDSGYFILTMPFHGLFRMMESLRQVGFGRGDYSLDDVILDIRYLPQGWVGQYGYIYEVYDVSFDSWSGIGGYVPNVRLWGALVYTSSTGRLGWHSYTTWKIYNDLDDKNYKNRPPFKAMSLWFQPFGTMEIDADKWGNDEYLNVMLDTDPMTGEAICYLIKNVNYGEEKEMLGSANVSVPITLAMLSTNTASGLAGLVGGLTSAGRNPITGLLSIGEALTRPPTMSTVSGGGQGNGLMDNIPRLIISRKTQKDPHLHTQGWLYNTTALLGDLHGYCLVAPGVHVESILKIGLATKPEFDEIESLLTSGVILP